MIQEKDKQGGYRRVAGEDEIAPGQSKKITIDGRELLLCNAAGAFHVIEDKCPHAGASFEGGRIRGKFISCPLHGARFDLTDGRCLGGAYRPVPCFSVKVEDGHIWIDPHAELSLITTGS